MSETIQVEKIYGGLDLGMLNVRFNVVKYVDEIQHYSASCPIKKTEYGAIIDDTHIRFPENEIGIFIPFTDSDKICWECGGERILELKINIDCFCMTWFDWCYNPKYHRKK